MKSIGTGTIKGERYEVFRDQEGKLSIKELSKMVNESE